MAGWARGLTVLLCLALPAIACGHGWRRTGATASYYAVPVAVPAVASVPAVAPACVAPPPPVALGAPAVSTVPPPLAVPSGPAPSPYAVPSPAPPSPTAPPTPPSSPGASQPKPQVSESRSAFDAYAAMPKADDPPPVGGRAAVCFWNLSERDVTLRVDGKTHRVARGQNLRLSLARQFVWREENREPQAERIPDSATGLEIVIRR